MLTIGRAVLIAICEDRASFPSYLIAREQSGAKMSPNDVPKKIREPWDFKPFLLRQMRRGRPFHLTDWQRQFHQSVIPQASAELHARLSQGRGADATLHVTVWEALSAAADKQFRSWFRGKAWVLSEGALHYRTKITGYQPAIGNNRKTLIRQFRRLAVCVGSLPAPLKGRLNLILRAHDQSCFDSDIFASLIVALGEGLRLMMPRREAKQALDIIYKPMPAGIDIERYARSELIDQWEAMAHGTRASVEAALRSSPSSRSVVEMLHRLIQLLGVHAPPSQGPSAVIATYVARMGQIAQSLGIRVGYADYQGKTAVKQSAFQDLSQSALQALGDSSAVSRRQIRKTKREAPEQAS